MKALKILVATMMLITLNCASCFAWGFDVRIESTEDTFKNTGMLKGTQISTAGGSSQIVALRGRTPSIDGKLRYVSYKNTYINDGDIIGFQTNYAGGSSQFVGFEAF